MAIALTKSLAVNTAATVAPNHRMAGAAELEREARQQIESDLIPRLKAV